MQVANDRFAVYNIFPVEGDNQAETPVHGGVMGTHVDNHGIGTRFNSGHSLNLPTQSKYNLRFLELWRFRPGNSREDRKVKEKREENLRWVARDREIFHQPTAFTAAYYWEINAAEWASFCELSYDKGKDLG
jgi:hypothetical protein